MIFLSLSSPSKKNWIKTYPWGKIEVRKGTSVSLCPGRDLEEQGTEEGRGRIRVRDPGSRACPRPHSVPGTPLGPARGGPAPPLRGPPGAWASWAVPGASGGLPGPDGACLLHGLPLGELGGHLRPPSWGPDLCPWPWPARGPGVRRWGSEGAGGRSTRGGHVVPCAPSSPPGAWEQPHSPAWGRRLQGCAGSSESPSPGPRRSRGFTLGSGLPRWRDGGQDPRPPPPPPASRCLPLARYFSQSARGLGAQPGHVPRKPGCPSVENFISSETAASSVFLPACDSLGDGAVASDPGEGGENGASGRAWGSGRGAPCPELFPILVKSPPAPSGRADPSGAGPGERAHVAACCPGRKCPPLNMEFPPGIDPPGGRGPRGKQKRATPSKESSRDMAVTPEAGKRGPVCLGGWRRAGSSGPDPRGRDRPTQVPELGTWGPPCVREPGRRGVSLRPGQGRSGCGSEGIGENSGETPDGRHWLGGASSPVPPLQGRADPRNALARGTPGSASPDM